jgi:hypothetical protein
MINYLQGCRIWKLLNDTFERTNKNNRPSLFIEIFKILIENT